MVSIFMPRNDPPQIVDGGAENFPGSIYTTGHRLDGAIALIDVVLPGMGGLQADPALCSCRAAWLYNRLDNRLDYRLRDGLPGRR